MTLTMNILLLIGSFWMMEFIAWFTHKYIMHGLLWNLHRDHHFKDHGSFFERNDVFFLVFATPGFFLIFYGATAGIMDPRLWIGLGITLYGAAYVFVHDVFIHQRIKLLKRTDNTYFRAMRKAHKVHHKHLEKEDSECFGFLWVPGKYLKEARQKKIQ